MNKQAIYGLTAGLVAASIWGGMYVVSKVVLDVVPPFTLLTIRLVLGILALGITITIRQKTKISPEQFRDSFLIGFVGHGISLGFQFVGTKLSTASNGALVTSATPAFVLLFAPYLLHEKTTIRRVIALVISSLGVLAVIDPRTAEFSSSLFLGNLSLLGAALTWALYSVLVRRVSMTATLLASSAVMLIGGLPSSILFSLLEIKAQGIGEITIGIIGGILFIGIFSTAIAIFLWNYAFAKLPAAVASLTFFAQPVIGTLLGWFFLAEKITPLFITGGVLIGLGIWVSAREG